MSTPNLNTRLRELLRGLLHSADERGRGEPAVQTAFQEQTRSTEAEFAEARETASRRRAADQEEIEAEVERARSTIANNFEAEQTSARNEHTMVRNTFLERARTDKNAAKAAFKETRWTIGTVLEGAKTQADQRLKDNLARLAKRTDSLAALYQQARALLLEWKQPAKELQEVFAEKTSGAEINYANAPKLSECVTRAEDLLAQLAELLLPRFVRGWRLAVVLAVLWLVGIWPLGSFLTRLVPVADGVAGVLLGGALASAGALVVVGPLVHLLLQVAARAKVHQLYEPLCQVLADSETTRLLLTARFEAEHRQMLIDSKTKHNEEVRKALTHYRQTIARIKSWRRQVLGPVEARFQQLLHASEARRAKDLQLAETRYRERRDSIQRRYDDEMKRLVAGRQQRLEEIHERHTHDWAALVEAWRQAMARLVPAAAEATETVRSKAPDWDDPSWQTWQPPANVPTDLRLGRLQVRLDQVPNGLPTDPDLRAMTPEVLDLPAVCAFPAGSSLLLEAGDSGRAAAVQTLQAALFRLLTALPPGKARFVIIDPVGLGQNFATFMHLADHDEALVASRIWTEAPHIEHRLGDLTLHMENVIQKYLRNRYESITDYNAQAGEVAEAFRVLVVANFPVNFTADAIRRLVSIVQSGARCGVLTLVSVDTNQPLPKGFDLADLEQSSTTLAWDGTCFRWKDADFGPYPLTLDRPPEGAFADRLLATVGQAARNAQRVEVPFDFIAPAAEDWWKADSRRGIQVPLGRVGATQRQALDLGRGTAQHALVAGKTGSGKSTLLHALITNLSLLYSPDEVELYLVDFKKGVEFKTYAVHDLPHARVIAIESEREFGLSVLQRLDAELKLRGERFREARAQDLIAYRQAEPDARAPRVLLIVDEFQEFFVEDDRIAQDAAQLLDRLVRQGRAFGIHVLLGSQTLGGAYSLARSTIDQMAVRIALQCSEADAHLILSEDNSAARLLSRPGEAIYNDANGLVEGNNPFQVVWLGDDRREQYLDRVRDLARRRPIKLREAPVVFEGNAPADVSRNHRLNEYLDGTAPAPDGRHGQLAWLGEAMAINELTAAPFHRNTGSNLLVVGQQEETALGMLATAVVSLAAQLPPGDPGAEAGSRPRFYVIDGRHAEAPTEGPLARLPEVLPHAVRLAGSREADAILAELAAEVERRQKDPAAAAAPISVVLFALQRLRDLRRQEDDFSFSRQADEAASPAQQFATLLREGAVLGMHTLMWCDTNNNLQRVVDRQGMRELAMRVVFQMNVADSSHLIDNPLASKLGLHRALFLNETDGRLDKFRPYGLPSEAWLRRVQQQLRGRAERRECETASK
jgi:hypothetical protein